MIQYSRHALILPKIKYCPRAIRDHQCWILRCYATVTMSLQHTHNTDSHTTYVPSTFSSFSGTATNCCLKSLIHRWLFSSPPTYTGWPPYGRGKPYNSYLLTSHTYLRGGQEHIEWRHGNSIGINKRLERHTYNIMMMTRIIHGDSIHR